MAKVSGGPEPGVDLVFPLILLISHGNLFVTKWVHIQRHGLKLGASFSKLRSAPFSFPEIPQIIKRVTQIWGRVIFEKKERLLGTHGLSSELVFTPKSKNRNPEILNAGRGDPQQGDLGNKKPSTAKVNRGGDQKPGLTLTLH